MGEQMPVFFYSANHISMSEHGGTHIDVPIHFVENGLTLDKVPLERLNGWAVIIDVSDEALNDRDYLISDDDILQWEEENGFRIPKGCIVLLRTGYGNFWPDATRYLGTAQRGAAGVADLHFPGLSASGAKILADREIKAVGLDTASIDYGQSTDFEAHRILLKQDIVIFENVANLDILQNCKDTGSSAAENCDSSNDGQGCSILGDTPETNRHSRSQESKTRKAKCDLWVYVIALPMKIKGGSGGPLRMIGWKYN
eukprot:Selendium_serpulae@DN4523_c1_g2_i1.p1